MDSEISENPHFEKRLALAEICIYKLINRGNRIPEQLSSKWQLSGLDL